MDIFNKKTNTNPGEQQKSSSQQLSVLAKELSDSLGALIANPNKENFGQLNDVYAKYTEAYCTIPSDVAAAISQQHQQITIQYAQLVGYINNQPSLFAALGGMIVGMMQSALTTVSAICKGR